MSLVLFTKVAVPGQCKTRLGDLLTAEQCAQVALFLQERTLAQVKGTGLSYEVHVDGDVTSRDAALFSGCPCMPQATGDLGTRMLASVRSALERSDRVVLFGSDLYDLSTSTLVQAHAALNDHDLVIGPAADGGYGLIGMRRAYPGLFSLERWSTPDVCEQTVARARELGLSIKVMPTLHDIDTKEDLVAAHVGAQEVSVLGQGEYNLNFLVRLDAPAGSSAHAAGAEKPAAREVVRVARGSQMGLGEDQIPYEFAALELLAPSGVTPRPYRLYKPGPYLPFYALSMEYVEGRPLAYETDLPLAARLLSRVHDVPLDEGCGLLPARRPFAEMYGECERMFARYRAWEHKDPQVEAQIMEFFAMERQLGLEGEVTRPCAINTELNNTNFIVGDRPVIIDWEKPLLGEAEQDLAHFLAPTTTFFRTDCILTERQVAEFLSAYSRPFDQAKLDKYLVFTCLRGLTWCAMAQVEYAGERALKNEQTAAKIGQYLSPEFLRAIEARYRKALS